MSITAPSIKKFYISLQVNTYLNKRNYCLVRGASQVVQLVKNPPVTAGDTRDVWSLGGQDPLEQEIATRSSIPAWNISRTEEPGGLQSLESQKTGPDGACTHRTVRATKCSALPSSVPKSNTWALSGNGCPQAKSWNTLFSTSQRHSVSFCLKFIKQPSGSQQTQNSLY